MINDDLDQKPLVTDDEETYGPSVEDSSNYKKLFKFLYVHAQFSRFAILKLVRIQRRIFCLFCEQIQKNFIN